MLERFHVFLARLVTERRRVVLGLVALVALGCGAALPWLETETSSENLIVSFGGYEERVARFREHFGDTDNVMMLLVEGEDATSLPALAYQHLLARRLATEPEVLRVDGLTVSPMPRGPRPEAALEDVGTLDELDATESAGDDEEVRRALETLVASAPERFPLGLASVAERVSDADRTPIVEGDEVRERDVAVVRAAIDESPLVVGRLVSADRSLAAVVVTLRPEVGTANERIAFVRRIDAWLDANPPPSGFVLHRAGLPHLRTAISDYILADQALLVPLTVLVSALLLYAAFRWWLGMVLPLVAVGISVVVTVGGMAWVGERMTILTNVVPTLLIIITLSDSVHIIARWQEELRASEAVDPELAAKRALRSMVVACLLTSVTTAVGLGSLMVSQTQMMRRFGGISAIGTMIAYVVTVLVVPSVLGRARPPTTMHRGSEDGARDGWIERSIVEGTRALLAWPRLTLGLCALVLGLTSYVATRVEVDTALRDTFRPDDPVVVAMRRMDERLDGIRPLEVMLSSEHAGRMFDPDVAAAITNFETWAETQDGVLRTTSYTDFLHETWARLAGLGRAEDGRGDGGSPRRFGLESRERIEALRVLLSRMRPDPSALYVTADGRHAHVELRIADIGARRSIALIDAVTAEAERRFAPLGLEVDVTGEAYIGSRGVDSVVSDLLSSLGLSSVVIFVLLVALFRSVRYALLSIPPNVFPLACAVAWMVVRGIPLHVGTAIVFSLAVGVGVDGTIHTIARLLEERRSGADRRAAILRTAQGTGRAIVISALSLMLGFAMLTLSSFLPVRSFGELVAVAMGASLFSTLVLQPALVALFGGPDPRAPPEGERDVTHPARRAMHS